MASGLVKAVMEWNDPVVVRARQLWNLAFMPNAPPLPASLILREMRGKESMMWAVTEQMLW